MTNYEANLAAHPEPQPVKPAQLIQTLQHTLPGLGYHPWDCLLNDEHFEHLEQLISQLPSTSFVFSWTKRLLQQIVDGKDLKLSIAEVDELQEQAAQLNETFDPKLMDEPQPRLTSAILLYKEQLCQDAVHWIRWKRSCLRWERMHGYAQFQKRADEEYQAWKVQHKASSCKTYLPNLIRHYKAFAGCTNAKAQEQVHYTTWSQYVSC